MMEYDGVHRTLYQPAAKQLIVKEKTPKAAIIISP